MMRRSRNWDANKSESTTKTEVEKWRRSKQMRKETEGERTLKRTHNLVM
jgi:hypothetical protein